ncbi:MAG: FAD-dependent oxidoreductase, partial [Deltaproteobacteria bacterium]
MHSARRVPLRPDCPVKQGEEIEFTFEERKLRGREGEPLAVSLLAAGVAVFGRSVKYHRPRGPYCLNGHCSGCLVRTDGVPNVRSCNVALKRGMAVERQKGWPSAGFDFLRAADLLSGSRIDHHGMFTSVGAVNRVVAKIVRELSGFGHLPTADPPAPSPVRRKRAEAAIVGAGAAGLAAALRMSERGQDVTVLERKRLVGGRLLDGSERLGGERTCWQLRAEFSGQLER